jgi:aarF domain-containing kinase
VGFFKDDGEGEAMWEKQHELRAQKVYSLCSNASGI